VIASNATRMSDLPASPSSAGPLESSEPIQPREPSDEQSEAWLPAPLIQRLPEPEAPTQWIAGPLTARSARQTGVTVACALSFAGRRSELAAFLHADAESGRRRTDAEILGGAGLGRRRTSARARVMVR